LRNHLRLRLGQIERFLLSYLFGLDLLSQDLRTLRG
jgi:hypothetical protein